MDTIQKSDWLPTPTQELLLKALQADSEKTVELWQSWKSRINLDDVDAGSHRLLPLLYRKLQQLNAQDSDLEKYKGVYRLCWYKNQMLFSAGSEILQQFHARGIKTMLLKGAALTIQYYNDIGARPMSDIDILVESHRAQEALEVIRAAGFVPDPTIRMNFSPLNIPLLHGFGFVNSQQHGVDLHWHLLPEACQPDSDIEFWNAAVPTEINSVQTLSLCPTDLLFQILVTGARWEEVATIRWVVDALTVLNASHIDWQRILHHARKHRLSLPLIDTLHYLRTRFNARIPDTIIQALREAPVSRAEQREYAYKTGNYQRRLLGHFPMHWHDYVRLKNFRLTLGMPFGFVRYLQHFWGLEHLWQMPGRVLKFALQRINQNSRTEQMSYAVREMKKEVV